MSKKWKIPVTWEMAGVVTVEADTLQEAIDRANNDDDIGLPSGDYVESSFEVSFDEPELIRELYNNNQPDEIYGRVKSDIEANTNRLRKHHDNYDMDYDVDVRAACKGMSKRTLLPVNRVTLIRERYGEREIWSDDFWVDANESPSKELFQKAVEAFLKTEDGEKMIAQTCNDFNWGDAVIYVPDEIWNGFGIYPFDYRLSPEEMGFAPTSSLNITRILVDQDEVLIPNDYYDNLGAVDNNKLSLNERIQSASARATTSSSIVSEAAKEPETEI